MALEFGKSTKADNFTVLIWGADGTGKTPTLMHLAQHAGPAAVVDADGGLSPYLKGDEDWIDLIESEDPIFVRSQLEELTSSPGRYRLCGIDPISTIYTNLLHLVEQRERSKNRNTDEFDSALVMRSWMSIKNHNRDLMRMIRWIGMPIICTAREDNLWIDNKISGVRPAGDKSIGHEFTLNIRLTQPVPGGKRFATLIRDRLCRFPQRLEGDAGDPFFAAKEILRLYPECFRGQPVARETCSQEIALEIHHLIRELRLPHKAIHERLRQKYSVDHIEDLPPSGAGEVLDGLRETYRERQEGAQNK